MKQELTVNQVCNQIGTDPKTLTLFLQQNTGLVQYAQRGTEEVLLVDLQVIEQTFKNWQWSKNELGEK